MGSFNLSCGLSKLSIGYGNLVALYPLTLRNVSFSGIGDGACMISNDGPTVEFLPITLPIYGTYNDYGRVEQIERNKNTEVLEKYFGCDIQQIADYFCRPDGKKNLPAKLTSIPKPSAMMVHRHMADTFSGLMAGEFEGDEGDAYTSAYISPSILVRAGFVRGTKDELKDRYNIPFTHPKIKNLVLWSDGGNFCNVIYKNKPVECVYHMVQLERELIKRKVPVPASMRALKRAKISELEIEYDSELINTVRFATLHAMMKEPELQKYLSEEKLFALSSTDPKAFGEVMEKILSSGDEPEKRLYHTRFFVFGESYDEKVPSMTDVYKSSLIDPYIRSEVVRYITMRRNMYSCNQFFHPCGTGPQCGNRRAEAQLISAITKLHKKLSKRQK